MNIIECDSKRLPIAAFLLTSSAKKTNDIVFNFKNKSSRTTFKKYFFLQVFI